MNLVNSVQIGKIISKTTQYLTKCKEYYCWFVFFSLLLFLFFILDENSSSVLSFGFNLSWPVMRTLTLVYFYDNCVYIKVFNAEKQLSICSGVLFSWLENESFSVFVFNTFKKSSSIQTGG